MNQDEKREYNRLYAITNKERIAARREARRAGLTDARRCSVPGCDGVYDAQGYCGRHYMAWRRNGDPTEVRQIQHHGKTLAERLKLYTRRTRGCWVWTGAKSAKGYGVINTVATSHVAHRAAWEVEHGRVPVGLYVLHTCDNPACVRPDHLFLGTKADNNADMDAKGRRHTKLTKRVVQAIRRSEETNTEAAKRYGISRVWVAKIRCGQAWKSVT